MHIVFSYITQYFFNVGALCPLGFNARNKHHVAETFHSPGALNLGIQRSYQQTLECPGMFFLYPGTIYGKRFAFYCSVFFRSEPKTYYTRQFSQI